MTAAGWHRGWTTIAVITAAIALPVFFSGLLFLSPQQSSLDSEKRLADSREEKSFAPAPSKSVSLFANPPTGEVVLGEPLLSRGEAIMTALPLEWEGPFFEIMTNADQTMAERNARLISLATGAAAAVPRVQHECLRHLAFGLPNDELGTFVKISTAQTIPGALRREFLRQVLAIRPTELAVPLCEALSSSGDGEVALMASEYLERVAAAQSGL